ncbi:hypothetical protein [Streptomyces sp. NPDC048157]|uniref:hypothetical protein n=1 Tax=Streptomyces sp. NPDC048157 TaxID=3365503 RepID=UPI0037203894
MELAVGIATIVATVIALWAAWVAWSQATIAREQAEIAKGEADTAKKQLQISMEQHLEGMRPKFTATNGPITWLDDSPHVDITLTQTGGVPVDHVTISASGPYLDALSTYGADGITSHGANPSVRIDGMSAGAEARIVAHFEYRHVAPIRLELILDSKAMHSDLTWSQPAYVLAEPQPEQPRTPSGPRAARRRAAGY